MRTSEFMSSLDHDRILEAIRAAEEITSGEIRVFISRKRVDHPVHAAHAEFQRLGMTKTRHRNAVLFYVAPRSQAFAVVGDTGIHEKCGDLFWHHVAENMRVRFVEHCYTQGVIEGIERAGQILAKHFPRRPDDVNELPDEIVEG